MARVAAIDCGTNSLRLLVADVTTREDGTSWLRDVRREMRVVRLGQGVDATGRLAPEALERTRDALQDYTKTLLRTGVQRVRMVATSATRDAENRDEFFSMTKELLGTEAEVITGETEAQLSFIGAVGDLDTAAGPFLVVDVGGGSTELVLGSGTDVTASRSVDIGCVRITERCLHSDPPNPDDVAAAEQLAKDILAEAYDVVPVPTTNTWIGVAGTVTTLSAVAQGLTEYDSERTHLSRMSLDDIHRTTDRLLSMNHDERAALGPIHPGRVDVICGGAIVVRALADHLAERAGITELLVSEHDILDGIALSLC